MSASARLAELGIALPAVAKPVAAYVPAARVGGQIWTSGQLPSVDGVLTATGKLGAEVTAEEGAAAARVAVLNALAAVAAVAGGIDNVRRVVKVAVAVLAVRVAIATDRHVRITEITEAAELIFGGLFFSSSLT